MCGYSNVIMIGNLTRDPEVKYSAGGTSICDFSLAINFKRGNTESVSFVDCVAFQKTAEILAQYARKGSRLLVDGRLSQDSWQAPDGSKRSKLKVIAESFTFLSSGRQTVPTDTPVQPVEPVTDWAGMPDTPS